LMMALVFLVVFMGLTFLRQKKGSDAASPVENSAAQKAPAPTSAVGPEGRGQESAGESAVSGAAAGKPGHAAAEAAVEAAAAQNIIVENELYKITFTNRGGEVTSWILKRYRDDTGQPLDLVNEASKQFGYPLSLYAYDAGLRGRLAKALYVPSEAGNITAPGELSFRYATGGLVATKTFKFDDSYVIHASWQVTMNGAPIETLLSWPAGLGDEVTPALYASGQVSYDKTGDVTHVDAKKVSGGATVNGPFDWAGVSDLYFAAIFLPDSPQNTSVVTIHESMSVPRDPKDPKNTKWDTVPVLGAGVGPRDVTADNGLTGVRLFTGPKSLDVLRTVKATTPDGKTNGPSLEPLVDFGFWTIISKPLFLWLHWTYDHIVANWGWAILLLTLIINLIIMPLRVTSMKSSLKMQRIQPQVSVIREKYKKYKMGDPRQADMNKELSELYKEEGVNMFGGCLPMLIQLPLLFAFYQMLSKAVDLRQAHWLWLHDLSRPDPLHILPVFFIASMFLVQYITPAPGMDPAQRRMMAFTMPLITGVWTWSVASGLALYWAGSNIVGIAQQLVINRTSLGQQMRDIAAKRARRKTGQGKVVPGKVVQGKSLPVKK
jgi:YidC/Oxa1 family membrane protein insertase